MTAERAAPKAPHRNVKSVSRAATARRSWDDVMSNVYGYYRELCESAAAEVTGRVRAGDLDSFPPQKGEALEYATSTTKQEL